MEVIDYQKKCMEAFEESSKSEELFHALVYTGQKHRSRPVFRAVTIITPCQVRIGSNGKEYWGFVGLDRTTSTCSWYNYNDCVSLENWALLDKLIADRYSWMINEKPEVVEEIKHLAKTLLQNANLQS